MNNAQNGARIKVFGGNPDHSTSFIHPRIHGRSVLSISADSTAGGGTGFVRNITYADFQGGVLRSCAMYYYLSTKFSFECG